jgi:hypothetical protein
MLLFDIVLECVVDPLNTYNEVEDKHAKKKIDSFLKSHQILLIKKHTPLINCPPA